MNVGSLFSGEVAPYWPHLVFIGVSLLGAAAVTWGLVREADKFWSLTNLLIIGGVVLEAICTILLFRFDEGISDTQQSKIIALETRLAPRSLSNAQIASLGEVMKAFPKFSFDVSGSDREPLDFGIQIASALKLAGDEWKDWGSKDTGGLVWPGTGYPIFGDIRMVGAVISTTDPQLEGAVKTLAEELRKDGIDEIQGALDLPTVWPSDAIGVHIIIGTKR